MGTYKFTWAHPAEEVYVTGTFDNWTKSEKLDKVGNSFEKTVTLPNASEKIYYKAQVQVQVQAPLLPSSAALRIHTSAHITARLGGGLS
ncbi:hypothetical protein CH063_15503 [Colletotrichum higginsianum]|uniref:AMP-activated protein kinase glycogen-binding domain-containing protein n=1 Tax=Colletotrichum higginsianum (strain IMI 349063) TaxID=759273 RepID=H1W344_COLHI|nr:hypothetical protein CH063_15503 [Colletotrichum higginsianum]